MVSFRQLWSFGAVAVLVSGAARADTPHTIYLYSSTGGGSPAARAGVWGNGTVTTTREVEYDGDGVLRLNTKNEHEGVRFDLDPPVDLTPYRTAGYVRLRVHFHDRAGAQPAGLPGLPGVPDDGKMPGALPPNDPNALPPNMRPELTPRLSVLKQFGALPPFGGGLPGGAPGGGFPELPGQPGPTDLGPPEETNISRFIVTGMLDTGIVSGHVDVDLRQLKPDESGWYLFVLPVKDMNFSPGSSGPVNRFILTSDGDDSFYLAQAALVVENGTMTVTIRRPTDPPGTQEADITVRPGPITLVADVEAGAADPRVEWNFDADNVGNLPVTATAPAATEPPNGMPPNAIPPNGLPANPTGAPPQPAPAGDATTNGPRVDARGLVAKFEYPNEEQNYRVEVTVRDRSGKKDPVTTSLLVKVRA